MRQIFGSSTAASAAVVALFMGGLGVGGWWLGRRTIQMKNPLRIYARLELGIACAAASSPVLVWVARTIYLELGGVFSLGMTSATVVRLALAALVLAVPTILMGGTLPVVVHALEREQDLGRRRVAWLYGINTLGAVIGAFLAGFFLLERFGVRTTLWLGAVVNLGLALSAASMARHSSEPVEQQAPSPEHIPVDPAHHGDARAPRRYLLAVAALVGCAFFLMELVWYRMLASILGGSTYTMGLILALALLGIAMGGLLYALDDERRRPTRFTLAATCALEGLLLALPLLFGDHLALFAGRIRELAVLGFGGLVLSWTVVGFDHRGAGSPGGGLSIPVLVVYSAKAGPKPAKTWARPMLGIRLVPFSAPWPADSGSSPCSALHWLGD